MTKFKIFTMSLLAEGSLIPPVGSLNKPNQIKVTKQKVSYALTSPFLPLFYSHLLGSKLFTPADSNHAGCTMVADAISHKLGGKSRLLLLSNW